MATGMASGGDKGFAETEARCDEMVRKSGVAAMSDWILMEEALDHLKIQEYGRAVYRKKLESLRKHGKIRSTLLLGIRYYDKESLDALREAKATGKVCAASQGSTSSQTKPETSSPITGISSISTESAVSASLRGTALARKTMKQTLRSRNLLSNEKSQFQGSLIS
jgi:hypothetical protein